MTYYLTGDYYLGAQGDPGLFSFLGRVAGTVAKTIGSFVPGPAGAVLKAGGAVLAPPRASASSPVPISPPLIPSGISGSVTVRGPQVLGPSFTGQLQTAPTATQLTQAGVIPRGYHISKRTGQLVKNRRMNPANGHALRRAIRREKAFIGLAKSVLRGTGITVSRHRVGSKARKC